MKLRISGKTVELDCVNGSVKFIPDAEFTSSWRKDSKTIVRYAIFQPVDDSIDDGIVVELNDMLHFNAGAIRVQDVFVLGAHIEIEIETETELTKANIVIEEIKKSGCNWYRITRAIAK